VRTSEAVDNEEAQSMFFLGNLVRRAGRAIRRIARRAAPVLNRYLAFKIAQ
jgi:hypothetical protein